MPYTEAFKAQMVKQLLGPSAVTARSLSQKVGVPQPTLSKWLRDAATVARMKPTDEKRSMVQVAGPKKWTPAEKLRVVVAAEGLGEVRLGELLRREGLHEEQLRGWRDAAAEALEGAEAGPAGARTAGERRRMAVVNKRVKALEKELRRKEKALAETAALLVLKKKMADFLEAEGDSMDDENEK